MRSLADAHLPPWPPAARHIITGISKADRDEYDETRCSPVYVVADHPALVKKHGRFPMMWDWCNDVGWEGHILAHEQDGPFCTWCGVKL